MHKLTSERKCSQLSESGPAPTVGQVAEFLNQHPSTVYQHLGALGVAPTVVDVARFLKLDKSGVYRLLYAKRLERITGFGRARICPKSVERFLNRTGEHAPRKSSAKKEVGR